MKNEIITNVTRKLASVQLWGKKHSPELLIAGGIIGIGTGVVLACKATLKTAPVIEESKTNLQELKSKQNPVVIDENTTVEDPTTELVDVKKETAKVYGKTALKVARNYAPAAIVLTLSVGAILGSHKILKTRNIALATAYTSLDTAFKGYRVRVADRVGEEVENDIYNGFSEQKITVTETDENGKEVKTKEKIKVADPNLQTPFSRYFSHHTSPYAIEGNSDANYLTLMSVENTATIELRTRGYCTMDFIYRNLGLKTTQDALVVGWVFDKYSDVSDNVVDLRIQECYLPTEDGGLEKTYVINPNYDGLIYDRI